MTGDKSDQFVDEFEKAMAAGDMDKVTQLTSQLWIDVHLMATAKLEPDLKELTYIKTDLTTSDGGSYLISLLHVSGPKMQLRRS